MDRKSLRPGWTGGDANFSRGLDLDGPKKSVVVKEGVTQTFSRARCRVDPKIVCVRGIRWTQKVCVRGVTHGPKNSLRQGGDSMDPKSLRQGGDSWTQKKFASEG
jgi:hypothetical protein